MTPPTSANSRTGEPRLAAIASWAVLTASFALSASTWIAMAVLAGFTASAALPGIGVTLKVAWLMPVAVDGYVVVALVLWMSPVPETVAAFARKNTYGAAGIGIVAQSAYHLLSVQSETNQLWRVALAAIVGALPPAVAAVAVHMRALIRRETGRTLTASGSTTTTTAVPTPVSPAPSITPAPPTRDTIAADQPDTVTPIAEPAAMPEPAPARTDTVPTPAQVAARITPSPTTIPLRPVTDRPDTARDPKSRPRTTAPTVTARPLAAPAADTPVTAPEPAQLPLPYAIDEALLGRAQKIADQYRTEHGEPITRGPLAARLKVDSELASHALAALNLGPDNPTAPIQTVNGTRLQKASR